MRIDINPIAKPRMTQGDKRQKRPCVQRYWKFKDELKEKHPEQLGNVAIISFRIAMPKSWSKKKKREHYGKNHQQKPDLDNLVKAVFDSLCADDSHICFLLADKLWDYEGSITIYKNINEFMHKT